MFILRIIRYFLGFVRFCADRGYPEKFLSIAAGKGIILWDIRRDETAVYASVLARKYKKLRPAVKQSGVKLRVIQRRGVPFKVFRYRRRKGILLGVIAFFAVLWFFSSFIWTVEVEGNKEVPSFDITRVVASLGVRPGAFPMLLNVRQIEQKALLKLPDLSWMTINIKGSVARIQVRERIYPPDIIPENIPCNIKALVAGQIVDIQVYQGQAVVKKGDGVEKGDLLVSGTVEGRYGATRLVHASARITAKTQRAITVSVPLKQQVKTPTGKVYKLRSLNLFAWAVPLYFKAPAGNFDRTVSRSALVIAGREFPFAVVTNTYSGYEYKPVTYSREQADTLAKEQLAHKVAEELSGAKILDRTNESNIQNGTYNLTGRYTCIEEIQYEEELRFS
jgi:similar to stage IV sporulation protein